MNKFFVCYRRDDTGDYAGRIADLLRRELGQDRVFIDVDSIRVGTHWPAALRTALDDAIGVIVVIGPSWLTVERNGRPRLTFEDDWVRTEIRGALAAGKQILPIVKTAAMMPTADDLPEDIRGLAALQALEVRAEQFSGDAAALIEWARQLTTPTLPPPAPEAKHPAFSSRLSHIVLPTLVLAACAAALQWANCGQKPPAPPLPPNSPDAAPPEVVQSGPIELAGKTDCVSNATLLTTFIDVGFGDATLFQLGDLDVLIDAGPGSPEAKADIAQLIHSPLEYLFITHPHQDHFRGARELLNKTHISAAFWNGDPSQSMAWRQLQQALSEADLPLEKLPQGEVIDLAPGFRMEVLSTADDVDGSVNDKSLVQLLEYCGVRILMTGDIEEAGQKRLLQRQCSTAACPALKADVLKFPHHGSERILEPFLDAVKPTYATISAGPFSRFGIPGAKTVHALEVRGIQIRSTSGDDQRNIELRIKGGTQTGFLYYDRETRTWKRYAR